MVRSVIAAGVQINKFFGMNATDTPSIGFIGLGVMGSSMAGHILKSGYPLTVFNRTRSKADHLIDAGAVWANSPAEIAKKSDIIFTIIGDPSDVKRVYLEDDGLVQSAHSGTMLVDMTTSSPKLAQQISEVAATKDISVLDAPVSGGDRGAREATLSIMIGGNEAAYGRILPILKVMGKNIVYQGPAGSGQHTKMANQIAVAAGMFGITESLAYAKKSGLDPEKVLQSISSGAAGSWSLSNLAPRILNGDFAPGFFVKHFIKDMRIALESAESMELSLPCLEMAKASYDRLAALGHENLGTQALAKLYFS